MGYTGLHYAVLHQNALITHLLLKRGVKRDVSSISGDTLLHLAARNQDIGLVQLLASSGDSLLAVNARGDATIHETIRAGARQVVEEMLARGSR